jgi:hypothetical protein
LFALPGIDAATRLLPLKGSRARTEPAVDRDINHTSEPPVIGRTSPGTAPAPAMTADKERRMKLAAAMVARTLDQYDAKVLPESHPAVAQLSKRFGDHTFFIDQTGLSIIEPTEADEPTQTAGVVVNLANWSDTERSSLEPHAPEMTDIVVELGPTDPHAA